MTWTKGSSGNPRGRPRGYTLREALRKRFLAVGPDERTLFDRWAEELISQAESGVIGRLDLVKYLEGTTPPELPPEIDDDARPRISIPGSRPGSGRAGRSATPGRLESGSLPRDLLICGAAGTGKTYGILEALHCIAADYPGLRIADLPGHAIEPHRIGPRDLRAGDTHRGRMRGAAAGCTRRMRHSYLYPSGSEVVIGGLDKPGKVLSQAWDIVYINEAIETTEEMWETLQSRLSRPGRPTWLGYLIGDTNPGDPSHWLKKRAEAGNTVLWDTSHRANPRLYDRGKLTAEGKLFEASLDRLTGSRRKRLRDGLWAAGDGAWFDGFDASTHVSESAEYSDAYPVHLAVDSGVHSAAVWFQVRPPGVTVFGDYYAFSHPALMVGQELVALSGTLCGGRVDRASTDPAGRSATAIGPTVLEEYRRADFRPECWPVRTVTDSLALLESFVSVVPPELIVHPRCVHLINAFANYKRAKTNKGQWLERPEDPQHPYEDMIDALKGGLCAHFPEGRKLAPKFTRRKAGRVF